MPMPCARSIAENIASGSSNMVWVGAIFSSIMYGITTVILSIRLNNRKPAIAVGNISRGKYTCWMRAALETRHAVQLLNVLEKELKMRIPIIILSGRRVSESPRKMMNTRKKIPVNAKGSNKDQK